MTPQLSGVQFKPQPAALKLILPGDLILFQLQLWQNFHALTRFNALMFTLLLARLALEPQLLKTRVFINKISMVPTDLTLFKI